MSATEAIGKDERTAALRAGAPPARWQAVLQRILEYDFTRPLPFLALAFVYLAVRIPWLNLGYGTDPDAWRVALSAEHLLSDGEYLPSRLPGYPLHEFATVPLIRAGWVWTNLSTAVVSLVAYSPVLATYGLHMFNFYDASVTWRAVLNRLGKDALGVVGALAVLVALAMSARNLRELPNDLRRDRHVLVWVTAIVVYFLSFARLPHEIGYLIPIFPFGLFLLSRYLRNGGLAAAGALIILAGFVDVQIGR